MLEAEPNTNTEFTILDYLNRDSWRAVLRYVPMQDLLRSENVSRRWQRVVLQYLEEIRFSFWGREDNSPSNTFNWKLRISAYQSFTRWTGKLGSRVVATYCKNGEHLNIIKTNCPNLEALTLINFEPKSKDQGLIQFNKDLKSLKRLCFHTCTISDELIKQYIAHKPLEELQFSYCEVTGECLDSANLSNIKSLTFKACHKLLASHILTSVNLTKLELLTVPREILTEIQLVLDKMPKLEWLEMHIYQGNHCHLEHYNPLCSLTQLKHLSTDLSVSDDAVEAITRCCKELRTLELCNCELLSLQSLRTICRNAGERLTEFAVYHYHQLLDDNVVDCVRRCPKLTLLCIGGMCGITPTLPEHVSDAKQDVSPEHVLHLDLTDFDLYDDFFGDSWAVYDYLILVKP
ncbi:uncharacterized protein LOC125227039 [Leguminivora glycinivorella]|uniref:uncharacterized protein LOC125227039 n=1 Tax=Leguminivora glycinivorella TaxID=1035111 RepID=UPI00200D5529|nr:uncharacterized protein LOC125227039 [Leguminivora glycinivorella]